MTTPNTLRRLNWLWKHRHTHDDDTLQEQITVIREIIERDADTPSSAYEAQAHVHLTRSATQSIAVGGEKISWDAFWQTIPQVGFDVSLPETDIEIDATGYYDIHVEVEWDTHEAGGSVWIVRTRRGGEETVWPTTIDPGEWTATDGKVGGGIAGAIPLETGDSIAIYIDHNTGSAQDLASASLVVKLVQSASQVDRDYAYTSGEDSISAAMPSNMEVGDLLLSFVASAEPTVTTPSGWTREVNVQNDPGGTIDQRYILDWKIAEAGEVAADYTVSGGTGDTVVAALVLRIPASQVDTGDPFDSSFDSDAPAQDTASASCSVTTSTDGATLIMFAGGGVTGSTVDHSYSGLTKRAQVGLEGANLNTSYATTVQTTAGASGTKTVTISPTPTFIGAIMVALTPP